MKLLYCLMAVALHLQASCTLYHQLLARNSWYKILYALGFFLWGIWLLKKAFEHFNEDRNK